MNLVKNKKEQVIKEVTINRLLNAPREAVFRAWTVADQVSRWFGPNGFYTPVCEIDPKQGGKIRLVMRGPDGVEYSNRGIVEEIKEPEYIIFSTVLEDLNGNPIVEDINYVTFDNERGRTRLSLTAQVIKISAGAEGALAGMEEGWEQTIDRLEDLFSTNDY